MTTGTRDDTALLEAMLNLTRFHREHEKFYASSPREFAITLQRHARTLQALADEWSTAEASTRAVLSPYEGAEDLNSPAAMQLDGVLFLEGEGRPAEISHLIRDLRNAAEDQGRPGSGWRRRWSRPGRSRPPWSRSTVSPTCSASGTGSSPTTGGPPP